MLADILLLFVVAYSIKIIVFGIAAFRAQYPSNVSFKPNVSIIIAARNEEENIRQCLDSMIGLSYPSDLLEIIIVDDRSTDDTAAIVREYTDRHSHLRCLTASPGTGNLHGKTNAVAQGIEASSGEILIFTDADCAVPVRWVEETAKYYADPSVGIVAGFTALKTRRWFEAIQALDWFVLFSVAAATVRLKYPVTAVGNNLSVQRAAYDKVGGYRTIPFSVTEDYALFHAITRNTDYRAVFPIDPSTLVESEPCKDWKELYRQKKRWFTGGRGMDMKSLLVFAIPYGMNLLLFANLLFAPSLLILVAFVIKTTVDLFLALPSISAFRQGRLLRYFLIFEVYYIAYVLLFPLVVLVGRKVIWKERTFETDPP
jgi:cellulose synthase/poly-beta-1,6-N-acetylglucosamine synthase-like glycosyltransferase